MSVGHSSWELKTLIDTVCLFLFHRDCIILGLWILLSICFIHSNFADNLVTQLFQNSIEKQLNIFTGFTALLLDSLSHSIALIFLCLCKLVNLLLL